MTGTPSAPAGLENILITEALQSRAPRQPDYRAEASALAGLAAELGDRPHNLLQKLTDTMIELGLGQSAGISLRERDGDEDLFRWVALSGAWAHLRGERRPFAESPSGVVISRDAVLLFEHPERVFAGNRIEPLIEEALLVPLRINNEPIGTVWALAHETDRKFDLEDARLMGNLAGFAAAGDKVARALSRTEGRYRQLFDSIDEGFCIVRVMNDEHGRPVDYRFLETNASFQRQTGLVDAVGRTMRELRPDHEEHWFRIYGEIARTGEARRFEAPAEALGRHYSVFAFPIGPSDPDEVGILFMDIGARKRAERDLRESEERARLLLVELQHRVRNSLAVVRSIVRRTAETTHDIDDMSQHLQGRIDTFARVQSMVARNPDAGVDLTDLVEEEMLAYAVREGAQLKIDGPALALQPRSAETLSLAIHELATNSVKYGALSGDGGRIEIGWKLGIGEAGERLEFHWTESGGRAPSAAPTREGFGMELLLRTLPYELAAETSAEFEPEGFSFSMRAPTGRLLVGQS